MDDERRPAPADLDEPAPDALAERTPPPADVLEEIADDMEDVIQRLGKLERQVREMVSAVAAVQTALAEHAANQYRLMESLRGDVAGDRKGLALRALFDPAASALDQLEVVRGGFDPEKEQAACGQVAAAIATLANLLQSLGFARFVPEPGDRFDPMRMQCLGYAPGEPGVVLRVLRPGYLSGDTLVRPSGVLIADPERRVGEEREDRA